MSERSRKIGRPDTGRSRASQLWFGAMGLAGFGVGLFADRRPFGNDILLHPLVLFFVLVGLSLLILRAVLARPVPEVIPDRALMLGCALGLAAFLIGNFAAANMLQIG